MALLTILLAVGIVLRSRLRREIVSLLRLIVRLGRMMLSRLRCRQRGWDVALLGMMTRILRRPGRLLGVMRMGRMTMVGRRGWGWRYMTGLPAMVVRARHAAFPRR